MEKEIRYSDVELAQFEVIVQKTLEKAKEKRKEIHETQSNLNDQEGGDAGDNVLISNLKEQNDKDRARNELLITDLEAALGRLSNKTYGICRLTGSLIPKERLCAVPHTTTCISAKEEENKKSRPKNR